MKSRYDIPINMMGRKIEDMEDFLHGHENAEYADSIRKYIEDLEGDIDRINRLSAIVRDFESSPSADEYTIKRIDSAVAASAILATTRKAREDYLLSAESYARYATHLMEVN